MTDRYFKQKLFDLLQEEEFDYACLTGCEQWNKSASYCMRHKPLDCPKVIKISALFQAQIEKAKEEGYKAGIKEVVRFLFEHSTAQEVDFPPKIISFTMQYKFWEDKIKEWGEEDYKAVVKELEEQDGE